MFDVRWALIWALGAHADHPAQPMLELVGKMMPIAIGASENRTVCATHGSEPDSSQFGLCVRR
jgi:hypothetical protein